MHEITERYWKEVFVVDTTIYSTVRKLSTPSPSRPSPKSCWKGATTQPTHIEHFYEHDDALRLALEIAEIDTTRVVYGTKKRFASEVIRIPSREVLERPALSSSLR